jgi:hypothetical protein
MANEATLRKGMKVFCDHCGDEVGARFRKCRNGHETAWVAWWREQPDECERVTYDACALLCRPCHLALVRTRPRARCLADGPIDWFTGLRALPKYLELAGNYRWTREALKSLQAAMLRLQCLPTGEGIPW